MGRKLITLSVLAFFLFSIAVFAAGSGDIQQGNTDSGTGSDSSSMAGSGQGTQENMGEGTQTGTETATQNQGAGSQIQQQTQSKIQTGDYTTENGKKVELQEQSNNRIQLKSGSATAQTSMQMTQEQTQTGTKLQVKLSNGKNAEVKIMPDTASEKAIERLQLKNCAIEEGCTIELKEVGSGEKAKAAYEIKTQKESKVFGLFKAKMQVQAQVDAENGEVIKANKPWWAVIAAE